MEAPNWEVRRTAAVLLREFGGSEGLRELVPLLTDSEPLVQREAVHGLVMSGSDEAPRILLQAIGSAAGRTRETLLNELVGIRDERAAHLFSYLIRHLDRRREQQLYLSAVESLGSLGGAAAVEALQHALHQGNWRAPLQTRRLRTAAAQALRRIGSPAAIEALRRASQTGARGVRSAARAQLQDIAEP
jgi:HEAT repeat protein